MRALLILMTVGVFLAGCSGLPFQATPTTQEPPTLTAASSPVAEPTITPTEALPATGPVILTVWVPPQFDPNSGTPAGDLLKQRLQSFTERMPDVEIDVRLKAEEGLGGLYDSLSTASAAAPDARPDLVALPQHTLQASALKGLLQPFDGLTVAMSDPDWYEYARQLATLQSTQFGMPFAGDAQLLAYRPSEVESPATDWTSALESKAPLILAAADPQALFTFGQYQAAGGTTSDDQGRPVLDTDLLTEVLDFYAAAGQTGVLPGWLSEFQDNQQTWQAFQEGRAPQAIAWVSQYLGAPRDDLSAASVPTLNGEPFTLATGWVWALGDPHSPHNEMAARLAEFLTESSFLASWTRALGYLPPRPSALEAWQEPDLQAQLQPVALSARLSPPIDVLTNLGPRLQQAAVQVLTGQADPATAAQLAIEGLEVP